MPVIIFVTIVLGFIWFMRLRRSGSVKEYHKQTRIPTRTRPYYTRRNEENQTRSNRENIYDDKAESSDSSSDPQKDSPTINRTYLHAFRLEHQRELPVATPTIADLNTFSHILCNTLYDSNTTFLVTENERHLDTVATAVDVENKIILVAFNIKERVSEINSGSNNVKVIYGENFGVKEKDGTIVGEMVQYFEDNGHYKVIIVTTEVKPTTPEENAICHAEMQILAYARKNGIKIHRIGISKAACMKCKEELDELGIEHEHCESGNPHPKNWKASKDMKTKNFRTIHTFKPQPKTSKFKWVFHHNWPPTMKQFNYNVKRSVKLQTTFNCTVSNAALLDIYDNYDRKPWRQAKYWYRSSGKHQSDRTYRKGVYWETGVLQASAGASIFSVNFSLVTVSANAEINALGVSAGINATLINLQFNAGFVNISCGIKATTGFSVGADGIEFQFLGSGFSYGPQKIKLSSPLCDIIVNPNAIVGLLFIVLSNTPKEGIDPKCFDDFQLLISYIKKNFGGQPPPPASSPTLLTVTNQRFLTEQHTTIPQLLQPRLIHSNIQEINIPTLRALPILENIADGVVVVLETTAQVVTSPVRILSRGISYLWNQNPRLTIRWAPRRVERLLTN